MIDRLYTHIDFRFWRVQGDAEEGARKNGEHIVCKCCWITTKSTLLVFPPNSHKSTSNFHVIMYWGKPHYEAKLSSCEASDKIAKDIDDQFLPITVLEEIKAAAPERSRRALKSFSISAST